MGKREIGGEEGKRAGERRGKRREKEREKSSFYLYLVGSFWGFSLFQGGGVFYGFFYFFFLLFPVLVFLWGVCATLLLFLSILFGLGAAANENGFVSRYARGECAGIVGGSGGSGARVRRVEAVEGVEGRDAMMLTGYICMS